MIRIFALAALAFFVAAPAAPAKAQEDGRQVEIETPGGPVTYALLTPADFDPSRAYPIAIGGGYYWQGVDDTRGWILVTTSLRLTGDWRARIGALLDHLQAEYRPEGGRFHMVCYSACGGPAFTAAAAFPARFSSVTALTGSPASDAVLQAVKHMKIQLIVGERDRGWRRDAEAARRDFQAAGADVTLEIIPGASHVIDEIVGAPFLERLDALRP